MTDTARLWAARILAIVVLVLLNALSGSVAPSLALAVTWGPNGFFLWAFTKGKLRLPGFLKRVHPVEPVIYGWLGVALVKRIVATRFWPVFVMGVEPPPLPKERARFLFTIELSMEGAEICHALTFVLAFVVMVVFVAVGMNSWAAWTLGFNILLNGYPVMLQRSNRFRLQRLRLQPT